MGSRMDNRIAEIRNPGKVHVCVCLTHTFDYIATHFFDFMIGVTTKYTMSMRRSNVLPIDRNRTELVRGGMENPDVTHFLFLDTDIIPPRKDFIDVMVSYDLPIVGLLCTKKTKPYEPIMLVEDARLQDTLNGFLIKFDRGLVKVDGTGTGCLMVKREVFEALEAPYFRFLTSYQDGMHISEDMYFIKNSKEAGFDTYVDTAHPCTHVGTKEYGLADFYANREKR